MLTLLDPLMVLTFFFLSLSPSFQKEGIIELSTPEGDTYRLQRNGSAPVREGEGLRRPGWRGEAGGKGSSPGRGGWGDGARRRSGGTPTEPAGCRVPRPTATAQVTGGGGGPGGQAAPLGVMALTCTA